MGFLNRLFGSKELLVRRNTQERREIFKSWEQYLGSIPEKEQLINRLPYVFGERKAVLQELKKVLDLDLIDVFTTEKDEDDLVLKLQSLGHETKIGRVNRLVDCLKTGQTKIRYVYELLRHLYAILKTEAVILEKLMHVAGVKEYGRLVGSLRSEFAVEKAVLEKLGELSTFQNLFLTLAKRERTLVNMNRNKKRLLNEMQGLSKVFYKMHKRIVWPDHQINPRTMDTVFHTWVISVFNGIQDEVYRELYDGVLLGLHPDANVQFVNRPQFVRLAKEKFYELPQHEIVEEPFRELLTAFVYLFRQWYNHEVYREL